MYIYIYIHILAHKRIVHEVCAERAYEIVGKEKSKEERMRLCVPTPMHTCAYVTK